MDAESNKEISFFDAETTKASLLQYSVKCLWLRATYVWPWVWGNWCISSKWLSTLVYWQFEKSAQTNTSFSRINQSGGESKEYTLCLPWYVWGVSERIDRLHKFIKSNRWSEHLCIVTTQWHSVLQTLRRAYSHQQRTRCHCRAGDDEHGTCLPLFPTEPLFLLLELTRILIHICSLHLTYSLISNVSSIHGVRRKRWRVEWEVKGRGRERWRDEEREKGEEGRRGGREEGRVGGKKEMNANLVWAKRLHKSRPEWNTVQCWFYAVQSESGNDITVKSQWAYSQLLYYLHLAPHDRIQHYIIWL